MRVATGGNGVRKSIDESEAPVSPVVDVQSEDSADEARVQQFLRQEQEIQNFLNLVHQIEDDNPKEENVVNVLEENPGNLVNIEDTNSPDSPEPYPQHDHPKPFYTLHPKLESVHRPKDPSDDSVHVHGNKDDLAQDVPAQVQEDKDDQGIRYPKVASGKGIKMDKSSILNTTSNMDEANLKSDMMIESPSEAEHTEDPHHAALDKHAGVDMTPVHADQDGHDLPLDMDAVQAVHDEQDGRKNVEEPTEQEPSGYLENVIPRWMSYSYWFGKQK